MLTHLNANDSLDSNANANAIFQERMQIQMCWGKMFSLYTNDLFYLDKKQRNVYKHIINLFNK